MVQQSENAIGVVMVASPFDWLFAKGTLASCRYFMPDAPVTLVVDGEVDTEVAESSFDVTVIRKADVQEPALRRLGFGWGTTKLLAFWYARSETFLYLDSDAVLWGDLRTKIDLEGCDYLASITRKEPLDRETVENWFFDISFVEKHYPEWDWRAASSSFFCPGVFAARKGAFALADYIEILRLNERNPGKFKFGDMGFHNLMVFRGADAGRLRVRAENFQVIFPEHSQSDLRERFLFDDGGRPVVRQGDEQVLHMPDQKPLVDSKACYSEPMTFFRLKFLEQTEGHTGEKALQRLREEDVEYHRLRTLFLKRERRRKVMDLLKGHPGQWRSVMSRVFRSRC